MTPLMQPITHAPNFNHHDQFCEGIFIMAGCPKTPSNSLRNSNSGQLPSTTLTNGRERRRTVRRPEIPALVTV